MPSQQGWGSRSQPRKDFHEHLDRYHRTTRDPGVQVRLHDRRRGRPAAAGARRAHRPGHLAPQGRARVDARVAPEGVSRLAEDGVPRLVQRALRADRLPGDQLLLRAQAAQAAEQPRRGGPRGPGHVRQAGHSAGRADGPGRRGRGRRVRQRVGGHDVQEEAGRARDHLLLVLRGGPRAPRAGAQVRRLGRAAHRQLLRGVELGGLQRRLLRATCRRACGARWSCRRTSASTPRGPGSSSGR